MGGANSNEQTVSQPSAAKDVGDASKGVSATFMIVAVGITIIGVAIWLKWFSAPLIGGSQQQVARGIVVIDTSRIIGAATKQMLATPNLNLAEEGGKLSIKLSEAVNAYRSAGVLVLNSYSVISCPPELDKTAQVAELVGVKIE